LILGTPGKANIAKNRSTEILAKYAIKYVRVSTLVQGEEDKSGLARQDDGFERWCEDHPDYIPWEDEFSDIGKSAFKDYKRRGALTAIIELAEKGKFGDNPCLVIDSVSRLCREPQKEANKLLNRIFDAGLSISVCELGSQIWTEKDQIVYIIFQVMFLVAHGESREKSHRIKGMHDNHIERLKEGDLSMMFTERSPSIKKYFYPFWLDFHKATRTKDAHFTKNEKSEWAAKMFEWATEIGSPEISKRLSNRGIYAPNKKGKWPISRDTIGGWLKNRAAIGEFQKYTTKTGKNGQTIVEKRGEPIKGVFPSIVSKELFELVQKKRTKRIRTKDPLPTKKHHYLFAKATFCSECGQATVFQSWNKPLKNGEKELYKYLRCKAGYQKATEICKCTQRLTIHKPGVDFELDMLQRLQAFRWADFLTDEAHEQKLNVLKKKQIRLQDACNVAEQEVKNASEAELDYLRQGRAAPIALEDLKESAQKKYDEADLDLNLVKGEIKTEENKPRGLDQEKAIQKRIKKFIESGRKDLELRREFNSWFVNQGLVVSMDLRTGKFEIGMGKVERNELLELDLTLEDGAVLIKDPKEFKEFKNTRKNQIVEEKKLREELIKTPLVSDLVGIEKANIDEKILKTELPLSNFLPTVENYQKKIRRKELITLEGPLLPPDWKGEPDNHQEYWFQTRRKKKSRKE